MIFFDHAAASTVHPEITDHYPELAKRYSGNPEAAHQLGYQLRKALQELEERLFDALLPAGLKVEHQCFWGSNGTELISSIGLLTGDDRTEVWGSSLDHAAAAAMQKRCFGEIRQFALSNAGIITNLPAGTAPQLVYITAVQSEIGARQNLPWLIQQIRQAAPEAVILLDAVQSAAFYEYPADAPLPDLMLISGSKIGAPGGAVLLASGRHCKFFRDGFARLRQKEYLIGKADPLTAAMVTMAAELNKKSRPENLQKITQINQYLRNELADFILPNGQKVRLTVPMEQSAANILHFTLPGYQAGVLVRMFSAQDIMLSSGSACESESRDPSRILSALKYSRNDAFSGLRLSFAPSNTLDEAQIFLQKLKTVLAGY